MKIQKIVSLAGMGAILTVSFLSQAGSVRAVDSLPTKKETVKAIQAEKKPGLLGKVLAQKTEIIGGKVENISGTVLTVNKDSISYSVNTDSKTKFRRRFWGSGALSEIQAGDIVNVHGKWTDDTKKTIQASLVRDVSVQKRFGVFIGVIESISDSTIILNSENRGKQTVTVSSATKFFNRKEQKIAKTEILAGHRARVKGLWDSANNTIVEVTQLKDFSLPQILTPTPKKS